MLALRQLVGDRVARAARALPQGVAALDHELGEHAVEDGPVVERLVRLLAGPRVGPLLLPLGKLDEVLHRVGLLGGEETDADLAFAGDEGGVQLLVRSLVLGSGEQPGPGSDECGCDPWRMPAARAGRGEVAAS